MSTSRAACPGRSARLCRTDVATPSRDRRATGAIRYAGTPSVGELARLTERASVETCARRLETEGLPHYITRRSVQLVTILQTLAGSSPNELQGKPSDRDIHNHDHHLRRPLAATTVERSAQRTVARAGGSAPSPSPTAPRCARVRRACCADGVHGSWEETERRSSRN